MAVLTVAATRKYVMIVRKSAGTIGRAGPCEACGVAIRLVGIVPQIRVEPVVVSGLPTVEGYWPKDRA